MHLLIGSPKLRPMVRFMNGIHPSISFMNRVTSLFVPNSFRDQILTIMYLGWRPATKIAKSCISSGTWGIYWPWSANQWDANRIQNIMLQMSGHLWLANNTGGTNYRGDESDVNSIWLAGLEIRFKMLVVRHTTSMNILVVCQNFKLSAQKRGQKWNWLWKTWFIHNLKATELQYPLSTFL